MHIHGILDPWLPRSLARIAPVAFIVLVTLAGCGDAAPSEPELLPYSVRGVVTIDGQTPNSANIYTFNILEGVHAPDMTDSLYVLTGEATRLACSTLTIRAWVSMAEDLVVPGALSDSVFVGSCGDHTVNFRFETGAD